MKEKNNTTHDVKYLPEINQRFLLIMKERKISGYKLEKDKTGITQSTVTHIRNGRNKPSSDIIEAFLKYVPGLNRVWLITGEGEKYIDGDDVSSVYMPNNTSTSDNQVELLRSEIRELKKELKKQTKNNKDLLEKIIDYLDKKVEPFYDYMTEFSQKKHKENN